MTLFQYQDYTEQLAEIYKLFHPEAKSGKGAAAGGGLSMAEKKRMLEKAKMTGIKLPKKGM